MIQVVSDVLHDFLLLIKYFISTFFTESSLATRFLLPGFAIGIAISAIFLAVKIIKSIVWGS